MDTSKIEAILKEAMGLNVSSIGKTSLQNAIHKRMSFQKAANTTVYSNLLKTSPQEVHALIEEVSVTETWFFRDNRPFTAMVDFAKRLHERKDIHKLRILSLPCATGEEPYSIAISLLEAGFKDNSFQIDAVDINNKALDIAKEGIYRNNSFRDKEKEYLKEKYFQHTKKGFSLRNISKNSVKFHKGNLINLSTEGRNHVYHIIFCRNLLIYLNSDALYTALQTLDSLLAPRGLLFVGHAEPGIFTNSMFTPSTYQKTFSLVRKKDTSIAPHAAPSKLHMEQSFSPEAATQAKEFEVDKILAARLLLHKNKYLEAIALCEEHISEYGPTADALFWLATGVKSADERNKAIELLRRTIYLDPNHIEAMELLCQLYGISGDEKSQQNIKNRLRRVRERLYRPKTLKK